MMKSKVIRTTHTEDIYNFYATLNNFYINIIENEIKKKQKGDVEKRKALIDKDLLRANNLLGRIKEMK